MAPVTGRRDKVSFKETERNVREAMDSPGYPRRKLKDCCRLVFTASGDRLSLWIDALKKLKAIRAESKVEFFTILC